MAQILLKVERRRTRITSTVRRKAVGVHIRLHSHGGGVYGEFHDRYAAWLCAAWGHGLLRTRPGVRMGTGRKAEHALTKRITCLNPANGFRAHRRLRPSHPSLIWYTASTLGEPASQHQARRPGSKKPGGCGLRSNYSCLIGRSRRAVSANRDATLRELVGSRVATSAPCLVVGPSR